MLDRASTFADSKVIKQLRTKFIPVAVDVWYHERRRDGEGDYYRKVVKQSPRYQPNRTTQGFYVFQPSGKLIVSWNNRGPAKMKQFLRSSLKKAVADKAGVLRDKLDTRYSRKPPGDGLVIDVFSKVTGGQWAKKAGKWDKLFRASSGHDHLWISGSEKKEIIAGNIPKALIRRIASFHLVDNTRGEPPMWRRDELKKSIMTHRRKAGVRYIDGAFEMSTADGSRTFSGRLYGIIEKKKGKVTRFDLVVRGLAKGHGRYNLEPPIGNYPIAFAFALAKKGDIAALVPPQGSRNLARYWNP